MKGSLILVFCADVILTLITHSQPVYNVRLRLSDVGIRLVKNEQNFALVGGQRVSGTVGLSKNLTPSLTLTTKPINNHQSSSASSKLSVILLLHELLLSALGACRVGAFSYSHSMSSTTRGSPNMWHEKKKTTFLLKTPRKGCFVRLHTWGNFYAANVGPVLDRTSMSPLTWTGC